MDEKIKELEQIQRELDERTETEKKAERLISELKFEEANRLLEGMAEYEAGDKRKGH